MEPYEQKTPGERGNGIMRTEAGAPSPIWLEQAAAELETDEVSLIPKTIDDIRNFADEYNAPETVESVFRWDVSDFFYNYFFAGNYITVGGSCGDDCGGGCDHGDGDCDCH